MGVNGVENDGIDKETNEGYTTEGYAPASETRVPSPFGQQDPVPGTQAFNQPQPHARRVQAFLVPGYRAPQVHSYATRQGISPAQGHKEAYRRRRRVHRWGLGGGPLEGPRREDVHARGAGRHP